MFRKCDVIFTYRGEFKHPFAIDPDGYLYKYKREHAGNITWICKATTGCGGTIIENGNMMRNSTKHRMFCFPKSIQNDDARFRGAVRMLCEQRERILSNSEIYDEAERLFPQACYLQENTRGQFAPTIVRWKRPVNYALPKTIIELDELMQNPDFYHKFGRNEFGKFVVGEEGYKFYQGLYTVTYTGTDGEITSKILAFKIHTVLAVIEGLCVQLAADGCQKVLPRLYMTRKVAFDGITQMYIVQVIYNKKFYPFGIFLLQHKAQEVFDEVFRLVHEWLTAINVFRLMTDYEEAPRIAFAKFFPEAEEDGCAIHYIRAVGEYSIKKKIYADRLQKESRECASKAYALCFFPEEFIEHAINYIDNFAPVTGRSAAYCKDLIAYLRRVWLPKRISVANKEIRVNNGCEIFNWAMIRDSNTMQQNPFEFLRLLQNINKKISRQICDWRHTKTTAKQQRVEEQHKQLQAKFKSNLITVGLDAAIAAFFEGAKYLTKSCEAFFQNAQHNNQTVKTINYGEIWIQESERTGSKTQKRSAGKTELLEVTFTPTEQSKSRMPTKYLTITNKDVLTVFRATRSIPSTHDNLYFDHASISNQHAQFVYRDKKLFIRDMGKLHSIKVNGFKTGRIGVEWCPKEVQRGDTISIGLLEMVVNWAAEPAPKSPAKTKVTANTISITVRVDISNTTYVPIRSIDLTENEKVTIKKSSKKEPAAINNLNIKAAGLSFRTANILFADGYLFIYPVSNRVHTIVNGSRIKSKTFVGSGETITFNDESNDLPISIRFTYRPTVAITESLAIYPVGNIGTKFDQRMILFNEDGHVTIERGTNGNYHNGQFDAICLSKLHAYVKRTPTGLFIKDSSKSGTFILKNDRSTRLEPGANVSIQPGDTIQFGSSSNLATGFIRCAMAIIDSKQSSRLIKSIPPSTALHQPCITSSSFKCPSCELTFLSKNFLDLHIDRKHQTPAKVNNQCTKCLATFTTAQYLELHMLRSHAKKVPDAQSTPTSESISLPTAVQSVSKTLKRKLFHSTSQSNLSPLKSTQTVQNAATDSSSPTVGCPSCELTFLSKNFLDLHIDREHQTPAKVNNQCTKCLATFTTAQYLELHMLRSHAKKVPDAQSTPTSESISLPTAVQSVSKTLKRKLFHSTSQSNLSPLKSTQTVQNAATDSSSPTVGCPSCELTFLSKNFLDLHIDREHQTPAKVNNQCTKCLATFTTAQYLELHMLRSHANQSKQ